MDRSREASSLSDVEDLASEEEAQLDTGLRDTTPIAPAIIQEYSLPNLPNPEPTDGKVHLF
jgi:hypothetical protein